MIIAPDSSLRTQSLGEEIANSVSHGVGLLAAIVAVPFLVNGAIRGGDPARIAGVTTFAVTMVLLYVSSTLYHALPHNRTKRVFQVLDHGAIYLLIAGTYTPFTLGILRGAWGWTLFGLVWSLAAAGIAVRAVGGVRWQKLSTYLYPAMGWSALMAIKPLWLHLPLWGWVWILAGGIAYTAGMGFFAVDKRVRYFHFVWHLFVIAGTTCHFIAVLWYAA